MASYFCWAVYGCEDVDWQSRIGQEVDRLNSLRRNDVPGFWSDYPETNLFIEAYGATAEWRTSLSFLSRLREKDSPDGLILSLGAVDAHVYDNFFLSSVLGKTPTLGHEMLARLASPLGVSTVVTLNFEDLIEQAYMDIQNPITVYAVHHDAGLPTYHSKFGKNVLIKMHGDRYGLRADYSLDEMPSIEDCRHFTSYLARQSISSHQWENYVKADSNEEKLPVRNHLLVVGLAVQEERILELIRKAKTVLQDDFKVFWIAYTETDAKMARERLTKLLALPSGSNPDTPQFMVIQHHFVGLLLYSIYQHLTGSLPTDGAIFPARARVSVPPASLDRSALEKKEEAKKSNELASKIDGAIDKCFEDVAVTENPRKLVVVHSEFAGLEAKNENFYGIVSSASLSFSSQLNQGRQAVWIDLGEVPDADELYELMLHTLARKAGVVNWMPVLAQASEHDLGMSKEELNQARQQELARITHNPDKKWVIYLNARSGGAGANFVSVDSYEEKFAESGPNGWLDRDSPNQASMDETQRNTDCAADFVELLDGFCRKECPNIAVVLLCSKRVGSERSVFNQLSEGDYVDLPIEQSCFADGILSVSEVVGRAKEWIACDDEIEQGERRRFLFACASVNRVRSPSLLWSWAFHGGNVIGGDQSLQLRSSKTAKWLKQLHERHIVRLQVGGFVWMQFDIRRELRKYFRDDFGMTNEIIPRIHQGIAEWYSRLHVSSRSSRAATESAYHHCIRARFLLESVPTEFEKSVCDELTHQVLQSFGAAIRMLKQARPSILADGFTQGTCHRLEHLRYKQCRDKIVQRILEDPNPETGKNGGKRQLLDPPGETANADKIDAAIREFEYLTCSLNFEIAQEIGNHLRAFRRLHELSDLEKPASVLTSLRTKNRFASLGIAIRSPAFAECWLTYGAFTLGYELLDDLNSLFQEGKTRDSICDEIRNRTRIWLRKQAELITGESNSAIHEDVKIQLATSVVKLLQRKMQAALCEALHAKALLKRGIPFRIVGDKRKRIAVECLTTQFKSNRIEIYDAEGKLVVEVQAGKKSMVNDSQNEAKGKGNEILTFKPQSSENAWKTAARCYELAIEAKKAVQRDGLRYQERRSNGGKAKGHNRREVLGDDSSSWFDDQQRLDTQHALCLALAQDYSKAFRRLNEAEAFWQSFRNLTGWSKRS